MVGTHADLLGRKVRARIDKEMQELYPTPTSFTSTRNQIQGHFSIGLSKGDKGGFAQLKEKLLDLALNHPRIGVGQVQVPAPLVLALKELKQIKSKEPYINWAKFSSIASSLGKSLLNII